MATSTGEANWVAIVSGNGVFWKKGSLSEREAKGNRQRGSREDDPGRISDIKQNLCL